MFSLSHQRLLITAGVFMAAMCIAVPAADATAPSPAPLIVIDAGHGGIYSNANANGLKEKNVNLAVALALRTQLQARGYRVKMTRTTDCALRLSDGRTWNYSTSLDKWFYKADGHTGTYGGIPKDDLQARVILANKSGADLFISIHANGSTSTSARGTETYYSRKDELGESLAPYVHKQIVAQTGLKSRGTYAADYYVVRWTNMPAILVETAFISNSSDAALLKKSAFRTKIAKGIAIGVDNWMATDPYTKTYSRVSGSTASRLSANLSKADFSSGASVAVIANSARTYQLPGAPALAKELGAPLLWSSGDGPDSSTKTELARLDVDRLVLVGVEGSFTESAIEEFADAAGLATSDVEVLSASGRSALAASIATSMGVSASGDIMIVEAGDAEGRMIAAPIAAAKGIPLLLADNGKLGTEAAAYLEANKSWIDKVVLVGPVSELPASLAGGIPFKRVGGIDMAHRAATLNARYFTSTTAGATKPIVASYSSPASYLVAATRAGRKVQPLIPVGNRIIPSFTREWITNRRSAIGSFIIIDKDAIPYLMDSMLEKADSL